ncbi:hypothetical protein FK004_10430 [Flavobacterium kingsejongi]|uniref:T9SS C-terminal target domain-containing protein n=1 Tax=Flavobacterium kingsejongi TaxID=1678728 RepID=A0A2S1LU87_9FLAO|nr:hypothetical protein FK004_10430 [Flavobacterium kingsejongi]
MKTGILFLLLFGWIVPSRAQNSGCTDPLSLNYNPQAVTNDGSCSYAKATVKPHFSVGIDAKVLETSGLMMWDGNLWAMNDDTDTNLYRLDTLTGNVVKSYPLPGVTNTDWEELGQDSTYLYVADTGNNGSGSRTDLHFLRINKTSFLAGTPVIDTIHFRYADQTTITPLAPNSTDFDMEAFVVGQDSLYLFSKQWQSQKTRLYAIPKLPGDYVALPKADLDVQGLVTGAAFLEQEKLVVLCGYSRTLQPFVYLLYDYKGQDFFSGNKRKLYLNFGRHQIEGITTLNGLDYYLTNERFMRRPLINSPEQLHKLDLRQYLGDYLKRP